MKTRQTVDYDRYHRAQPLSRLSAGDPMWVRDANIGGAVVGQAASFFFGARIWLGTILGRFSINYFSGLGLRIRVWVRVRVSVGIGVRVTAVIWSG